MINTTDTPNMPNPGNDTTRVAIGAAPLVLCRLG
jgi:hypothetical protein